MDCTVGSCGCGPEIPRLNCPCDLYPFPCEQLSTHCPEDPPGTPCPCAEKCPWTIVCEQGGGSLMAGGGGGGSEAMEASGPSPLEGESGMPEALAAAPVEPPLDATAQELAGWLSASLSTADLAAAAALLQADGEGNTLAAEVAVLLN